DIEQHDIGLLGGARRRRYRGRNAHNDQQPVENTSHRKSLAMELVTRPFRYDFTGSGCTTPVRSGRGDESGASAPKVWDSWPRPLRSKSCLPIAGTDAVVVEQEVGVKLGVVQRAGVDAVGVEV